MIATALSTVVVALGLRVLRRTEPASRRAARQLARQQDAVLRAARARGEANTRRPSAS